MRKLRAHLRALRRRRQLAKHAKLRAAKDHENEIRKRKRRAEKRLTRAIAAVKVQIRKRIRRRPPEFDASMLNGCPGNITREIREIIAYADAKFGMVVTATTNGTHAAGSWHYEGRAVDLWHSSVSTMIAFQRFCLEHWGVEAFLELFGPDAFYVKNGARYSGAFPAHGDHDHVAR